MENKIKHLEMIEAVIERLAKNSFLIKGWTMTLVAFIGTLAAKDADKRFLCFVLVPVIGFWVLDAFYLQRERRFRMLYKAVTLKKEEEIDFSLEPVTKGNDKQEKWKLNYWNAFLSISESGFYGVIIIGFMLLMFLLKWW